LPFGKFELILLPGIEPLENIADFFTLLVLFFFNADLVMMGNVFNNEPLELGLNKFLLD